MWIHLASKNSPHCASRHRKAEKVAARRAELEGGIGKLAPFGKPAKKSEGAPLAKARKATSPRS
jgi:hypothetical protein